ncbi:MAG: FtsQ-type POTRA domain-containing protein [Anaerolineales bacterium]|nr:FtsQ-type POTRA domain-containing protein [Anaerolineales bacterium]
MEIRLPSMPVVQFSWRLLSLVLTAGLIALLYYLMTSPQFQVQSVEVQGALRLSAEEINSTLRVYNQSIFRLNTDEMKRTLELAYAELKDVSVQVGFPAEVLINVSERVPLIAWVQDSGTQWVDGDGYAFSPRGGAEKVISVQASASPPMPAQVPVDDISLEDMGQYQAYMEPELIGAILKMRAQAPEKVTLMYDSQYGLGWDDPRGWEVYFGLDGNDVETKLLVYKAIVKQIKAEGITPVIINVEHVHAPYYRMER